MPDTQKAPDGDGGSAASSPGATDVVYQWCLIECNSKKGSTKISFCPVGPYGHHSISSTIHLKSGKNIGTRRGSYQQPLFLEKSASGLKGFFIRNWYVMRANDLLPRFFQLRD